MQNRAIFRNGNSLYGTDGTTAETVALPFTLPTNTTIQVSSWYGPRYDAATSDAVFAIPLQSTTSPMTCSTAVMFTDGTVAGTSQQIIPLAEYSNSSVAVIGRKVVVVGVGTNGNGQAPVVNLGVTDGTAAGTGLVRVNGAGANGLSPSNTASMHGGIIIYGSDSSASR